MLVFNSWVNIYALALNGTQAIQNNIHAHSFTFDVIRSNSADNKAL